MRTRSAEAMAFMLVLGAAWHCLDRDGGVREFALSLLSLSVVWTASILLHEIGHAAAARAVNLEPTIVLVGGGPSILRREVFGVAFDLGWLTGGGLTMIVSRARQRHLKWRLFATYLGGPLVSIGLLLVGLVVFPQSWTTFRAGTDAWIMPGTALVLVNGLVVLTITVPMPRASDMASLRNDLVQIVMLPWAKPASLDALVTAAVAAGVTRLYVLGKFQAAFEEGRRVLAADPSNWVVRCQIADMLICARRYPEAAVEYGILLDGPALSEEEVPPLTAALIANNYAWAIYMLNEADRLEAADRASSKAIAAAPNNPSVLGTRGAVLVEQGQVESGRRLLKRALRLHSDRIARASVLACLAIASARDGDQKESRSFLDRARRLDRDCDQLARAEGALSKRRDRVDDPPKPPSTEPSA